MKFIQYLRRYKNGHSKDWTKPITTVAASSTSAYVISDTKKTNEFNSSNTEQGHEGWGAGLGDLVHIGLPHIPTPVESSSCNSSSNKHVNESSVQKSIIATAVVETKSVPYPTTAPTNASTPTITAHTVASDPTANQNHTNISVMTNTPTYNLPMFSSQCPGWVCYAEKTVPQVLPYISTTKSAQQILGSVIKRVYLGDKYDMLLSKDVNSCDEKELGDNSQGTGKKYNNLDRKPRNVYIVSVQPCFDKKLEGSRKV